MTRGVERGPTAGFRWLSLGVVLVVLTWNAVVRADAFDVADTSWEGGSELYAIARAELGSSRVKAVGVLDWDEVSDNDGVLVIHPLETLNASDATAFMKAGGRLAIVDDYGRGDETLARFKIQRTGTPARPVTALRNNPKLAIAEPVVENLEGRDYSLHPVVTGVQRLVTNHPTGLIHPNLSPVLRIRAIGEDDTIIAVAGQVESGRLFAMSDPSATINHMLRYPGNRAFVAGLVRYLANDGQGRGSGRLWIVTNHFSEEGSYGGETTLSKDLARQLEGLSSWLESTRTHWRPPVARRTPRRRGRAGGGLLGRQALVPAVQKPVAAVRAPGGAGRAGGRGRTVRPSGGPDIAPQSGADGAQERAIRSARAAVRPRAQPQPIRAHQGGWRLGEYRPTSVGRAHGRDGHHAAGGGLRHRGASGPSLSSDRAPRRRGGAVRSRGLWGGRTRVFTTDSRAPAHRGPNIAIGEPLPMRFVLQLRVDPGTLRPR